MDIDRLYQPVTIPLTECTCGHRSGRQGRHAAGCLHAQHLRQLLQPGLDDYLGTQSEKPLADRFALPQQQTSPLIEVTHPLEANGGGKQEDVPTNGEAADGDSGDQARGASMSKSRGPPAAAHVEGGSPLDGEPRTEPRMVDIRMTPHSVRKDGKQSALRDDDCVLLPLSSRECSRSPSAGPSDETPKVTFDTPPNYADPVQLRAVLAGRCSRPRLDGAFWAPNFPDAAAYNNDCYKIFSTLHFVYGEHLDSLVQFVTATCEAAGAKNRAGHYARNFKRNLADPRLKPALEGNEGLIVVDLDETAVVAALVTPGAEVKPPRSPSATQPLPATPKYSPRQKGTATSLERALLAMCGSPGGIAYGTPDAVQAGGTPAHRDYTMSPTLDSLSDRSDSLEANLARSEEDAAKDIRQFIKLTNASYNEACRYLAAAATAAPDQAVRLYNGGTSIDAIWNLLRSDQPFFGLQDLLVERGSGEDEHPIYSEAVEDGSGRRDGTPTAHEMGSRTSVSTRHIVKDEETSTAERDEDDEFAEFHQHTRYVMMRTGASADDAAQCVSFAFATVLVAAMMNFLHDSNRDPAEIPELVNHATHWIVEDYHVTAPEEQEESSSTPASSPMQDQQSPDQNFDSNVKRDTEVPPPPPPPVGRQPSSSQQQGVSTATSGPTANQPRRCSTPPPLPVPKAPLPVLSAETHVESLQRFTAPQSAGQPSNPQGQWLDTQDPNYVLRSLAFCWLVVGSQHLENAVFNAGSDLLQGRGTRRGQIGHPSVVNAIEAFQFLDRHYSRFLPDHALRVVKYVTWSSVTWSM